LVMRTFHTQSQGLNYAQIFADNVPFYDVLNEGRIILDVTRGKRPARPTPEIGAQYGLDDTLWRLIEACWATKPQRRPSATSAANLLRSCVIQTGDESTHAAPNANWDHSFVGQFRSKLDEHPFCPPAEVNVGWIGGKFIVYRLFT
jgi:hypothetical protein